MWWCVVGSETRISPLPPPSPHTHMHSHTLSGLFEYTLSITFFSLLFAYELTLDECLPLMLNKRNTKTAAGRRLALRLISERSVSLGKKTPDREPNHG